MKRTLLLLLLVGCMGSIQGQDFYFSQFYSAPLYLNPAMTGSSEMTRMGINYRKQWPGLEFDFNGYSAFIDHYSFDLKSGIGLAVNSFNEQHLRLSSTEVSFLYSYNLDLSDSWNLRMGSQTSYVMKNGFFDNSLFGDQIDVFNRTIQPGSMDALSHVDPFNYLDLSFGFLATTPDAWFGGSAHHVNNPAIRYSGENRHDLMDAKYSAHGGVQFDFEPQNYWGEGTQRNMTVMANYIVQGPFSQLDVSSQVLYDQFIAGLGYRGIPGINLMPNQDSIIFLLGFSLDSGLIIGYSYDWMISNVGMYTKGSHEFSMRYQFLAGDPRQRNRKSRVLSCFKSLI